MERCCPRDCILLLIYRIALTIQKNGSAQWESGANSQRCQVTVSGVKYKSSFLLHLRDHFCHLVRNEPSSQNASLTSRHFDIFSLSLSLSVINFSHRFYTAYEWSLLSSCPQQTNFPQCITARGIFPTNQDICFMVSTNRVPKCDVIKFLFLHFSIFITIFR